MASWRRGSGPSLLPLLLSVVSCSPLLHHGSRLQRTTGTMKVLVYSFCSSSLLLSLSVESCVPLLHHVDRLQCANGILFFIMLASCEASSSSSTSDRWSFSTISSIKYTQRHTWCEFTYHVYVRLQFLWLFQTSRYKTNVYERLWWTHLCQLKLEVLLLYRGSSKACRYPERADPVWHQHQM